MTKPEYFSACIFMVSIFLSSCGGSGNSSLPVSSFGSSTSSSGSSASTSEWELVWFDEFTGDRLDTSKWSFEKNCMGGGNNELQCYTDHTENAFVHDGKLHIVAKKETFSGSAKGDDDPAYDANDKSAIRDYTSARLRSKNKGDWKYGRIEIRAKLPQGQGIWPAIWMLPTEWRYGGWPLSGEIDIMEAVNSNAAGGNTIHGTLHYGEVWPNNKFTGAHYTPAQNVWESFHVYTVEWEEGEIRWYVDNHHYATQTRNIWYTLGSSDENAPFNQSFHLILNLAVGGNWPGNPDSTTQFPQEMTVEYVRVYRCSLNTENGKGCAFNINPEVVPLSR